MRVGGGELIKYGPPRPREPEPNALKEGLEKIKELRKVEAVLDDYRDFLRTVGRGVLHRQNGDEFMEDMKASLRLLKARFDSLERKKEKRDSPEIVAMYGVTIPRKK